ncbi:MAG: hypothetical protein GF417_06110 [Candidatus Latescibacteria bacterium]|nr:hypothetical protein [bacterium]MBD3423992.1 hypothetical protein [Candidatus Latescibacterota bacterium]
MFDPRGFYITALILALAGLLMSAAVILALIDIGQGIEPDLTLEWRVIRLAFPFMAIAQIISVVAIAISLNRNGE